MLPTKATGISAAMTDWTALPAPETVTIRFDSGHSILYDDVTEIGEDDSHVVLYASGGRMDFISSDRILSVTFHNDADEPVD
jgi:hypothetical protein